MLTTFKFNLTSISLQYLKEFFHKKHTYFPRSFFPFIGWVILHLIINAHDLCAQQIVPIKSYGMNANGQVQLGIDAQADHYYILKVRATDTSQYDIASSMTMGVNGTLLITEPLGAYPLQHYQIIEYANNAPFDTDLDGIDDITEFQNMPTQSPINAAPDLDSYHGEIMMDSFGSYKRLSIRKEHVVFSEYLNGLGHFKFMISDFSTDKPRVYFINTNVHAYHESFALANGENHLDADVRKGQIVHHPTSISSNGTLGTFAFNYTGGHGIDFDEVQRTHELLAANMPFIKNNLSFFVTGNSEDEYTRDSVLYATYRLPVLLESDVYADVDYWGLNQEEGFGLFRKIGLDEIPGAKDIVLYESIPNALPRVGGIITSVIQTPLSHVNLRAIQNKIPNAFIRDPLLIDSVADLLDKYIYFKVEQDKYIIREASLAEVNAWFEDIRPKENQNPPLNLCHEKIMPLDDIRFNNFDGFGAKCTNVATMRKFGFPDGTIPNGYGVPFYFYQEFMKHNRLFNEIRTIMNEPDFISNRLVRDEKLKAFRKKIKNAELPAWMMADLGTMQNSFPTGTSIRVRSSTNNEDLPGFNGAGLYTSKTQHPEEGHIAKSVKQVFASLWNLRAFEEREFYRVDHFKTSMGLLCHPNYSDEKANGVGVSTDPLYNTKNTFYLNSQIGEELITNPDSNAHPEELLLDRVAVGSNSYTVIQRSNLVHRDSVVLDDIYLSELRNFLTVIHDEFAELYHAESSSNFAMDIEYKITKDNQLIIKQARPWVSYIFAEDDTPLTNDNLSMSLYPNPATDCITVECVNCDLARLRITNSMGEVVQREIIRDENVSQIHLHLNKLPTGIYIMSGFLPNGRALNAKKFIIMD